MTMSFMKKAGKLLHNVILYEDVQLMRPSIKTEFRNDAESFDKGLTGEVRGPLCLSCSCS